MVLFLARVALICNLCFLAAFGMRYLSSIPSGGLMATLLVMGNIVSILVNTVLHLFYALFFLAGRGLSRSVPKWLLVVNFMVLIFQGIVLFT